LPGSFIQSFSGLRQALALKAEYGDLKVMTSSTITAMNLRDLPALLCLLDRLLVPYSRLLAKFRQALAALPPHPSGVGRRLSWTDLPLCVLRGLESHAGSFERVLLPTAGGQRLELLGAKQDFPGVKRQACRRCVNFSRCSGVSPAYVRRYGWKAFVPS
jgi:hypothetical protein